MTEGISPTNYKFLSVFSAPLLISSAYKWYNNDFSTIGDWAIAAFAVGGTYLSVKSSLQNRQIQQVAPPQSTPLPEIRGFNPNIKELGPYIEYLKKVHSDALLKATGNLYQYAQKARNGNAPRINTAQLQLEVKEFLDHVLHYFDLNIDEPFSIEFAEQLLKMGLDPCTSETLFQALTATTPQFPELLELLYLKHPTPEIALNQIHKRHGRYLTMLDLLEISKAHDPNLYDYDSLIEKVKRNGGVTAQELIEELRARLLDSPARYFKEVLKYQHERIAHLMVLSTGAVHEIIKPFEWIRLYAKETARLGSREWFRDLFVLTQIEFQNPIGLLDEAIKTLAAEGFLFNELDRNGDTILDNLLYKQKIAKGCPSFSIPNIRKQEAILANAIEILREYGAKEGKDIEHPRTRYYPDYFSWL